MSPGPKPEKSGIVLQLVLQIIITVGAVLVAYFQFAVPAVRRQATSAGSAAAGTEIAETKKAVAIVSSPPETLVVGDILQNLTSRPIIVTMGCNATGDQAKEVSGYASPSKDSGLDGNSFQVSVTGGDRLSATYVVPPGWYYKVAHTGAGSCNFKSWPI